MNVSHASVLAPHRARRGWSQQQLADASGVSRTEISAIETGRLIPSVSVALRLSSALGESVETLFGASGDVPAVAWAWPPPGGDPRGWRASVSGRLLAYPVEPTAAGVIAHDGIDAAASDARPDRTLVMAGCDPLVGLLVQEVAARHGVRVLPLLRSSTQALDLLQRGLVHIAGLHFTSASGQSGNDHVVRSRLGPGYRLIHQMRWEAGVAVAATRRERSARAILRANVRWVNREEGSAARRAFDTLLGSKPRPKGYGHIVRDHRAVAATVASGWAEAGMCVRPVANEAHLGFIALQQEAYELCTAERLLDDPRVAAVMATLQSLRYRRLIGDVPGCAAGKTGDQRAVA